MLHGSTLATLCKAQWEAQHKGAHRQGVCASHAPQYSLYTDGRRWALFSGYLHLG